MLLEWDEAKMATGISTIDQQHKELFNVVNELHHAMNEGRGTDELVSLMEFLKNYVEEHFNYEEDLMEKRNCPCAAENKQAHKQFHEEFTKLYQQFKKSGANMSLLLQVHRLCSRWLYNHICKVDNKIKSCA